ncbi:HAMP domain-containing sensor histidine kinase [Uliginosibacterium sp. H3]|uniref:histidine kinase n=1 Tax=Uliginosibacterium silvisoli TaxID=3114758 RepID=A0ABU6K482_9RHOO|nr:HAMP domain-containing sensor histidine kinase [Uliginosibacterium sp. H3]
MRLPYSLIKNDSLIEGAVFEIDACCLRCKTFECTNNASVEIKTCSYGVDYIRLVDNSVMVGFSVVNPPHSSAKQKRLKNTFKIKSSKLKELVDQYNQNILSPEAEAKMERARLVDEYVDKIKYTDEFLKTISPEIKKAFSSLHDYKSLSTQLKTNLEVLLLTQYGGSDISAVVERLNEREKAIYFISRLLAEKLSMVEYMLDASWIKREAEKSAFRFHGLVKKYSAIYQLYLKKNIQIHYEGESRAEIFGNSEAISVIPHTLIDNAFKYSRRSGHVYLKFQEKRTGIDFCVESWGPKIKKDELSKIFDAFYRGESVRSYEGSGYGLYLAQFIARNIGSKIHVEQDEGQDNGNGGYKTSFSVLIPYRC